MNPIDLFIIVAVAAIVGLVMWYIRSSRKKGVRCIGCPDGAKCAGSCSGCQGNCGGHTPC